MLSNWKIRVAIISLLVHSFANLSLADEKEAFSQLTMKDGIVLLPDTGVSADEPTLLGNKVYFIEKAAPDPMWAFPRSQCRGKDIYEGDIATGEVVQVLKQDCILSLHSDGSHIFVEFVDKDLKVRLGLLEGNYIAIRDAGAMSKHLGRLTARLVLENYVATQREYQRWGISLGKEATLAHLFMTAPKGNKSVPLLVEFPPLVAGEGANVVKLSAVVAPLMQVNNLKMASQFTLLSGGRFVISRLPNGDSLKLGQIQVGSIDQAKISTIGLQNNPITDPDWRELDFVNWAIRHPQSLRGTAEGALVRDATTLPGEIEAIVYLSLKDETATRLSLPATDVSGLGSTEKGILVTKGIERQLVLYAKSDDVPEAIKSKINDQITPVKLSGLAKGCDKGSLLAVWNGSKLLVLKNDKANDGELIELASFKAVAKNQVACLEGRIAVISDAANLHLAQGHLGINLSMAEKSTLLDEQVHLPTAEGELRVLAEAKGVFSQLPPSAGEIQLQRPALWLFEKGKLKLVLTDLNKENEFSSIEDAGEVKPGWFKVNSIIPAQNAGEPAEPFEDYFVLIEKSATRADIGVAEEEE